MKTNVVYHSADYDGIFCREIGSRFIPEAEFIGWNFGDPMLPDELLRGPLVVLDLPIDRPFGIEFKNGWICRDGEEKQPIDRWDSSNITWIDHHKTSIDTHPPEIPGYRIDGVAACRLAWQWFTELAPSNRTGEAPRLPEKRQYVERIVAEPLAVRLVGEYDIWDRRDPNAALFQYGLRAQKTVPFALLLESSDRGTEITHKVIGDGQSAEIYAQSVDAANMKASFFFKWEGLTFLCLNGRGNSLTFASRDTAGAGHDALLMFYFKGDQWVVSLYHARHCVDLDLSEIAKRYGGGGHRGACGFTATKLPWLP